MNDSQLYLLSNVEIDADNEFTIDFDSATAQQAYFQSKISDVLDTTGDFSYIRKDADVKVEKSLEDLLSVNYLMFKNDSKWWYARITNKEYISPTTTRIYFEIDAFQTFMFDFEIQESFIDREHQDRWEKQSDGTLKPIYNIEEENLEIGGEYNLINQVDFQDETDESNRIWYIVKSKEPLGKFARTVGAGVVDTWFDDEATTIVNGIDTGVYVYIAPQNLMFRLYIDNLNQWMNGFYLPKQAFENPNIVSITPCRYLPNISQASASSSGFIMFKSDENITYELSTYGNYDESESQMLVYVRKFGGIVKQIDYNNNDFLEPDINSLKSMKCEPKLKASPYNILKINAYNESKNYNRAFFENTTQSFEIDLSLGMSGNINILPLNYNKSEKDLTNLFQIKNDLALTLRTDKWQEYVLNNKASMNGGLVVSGVQSLLGIGLGIATGGLGLAVAGSTVLGFGGQIANEMIKRQDIKNQPDDIRPNVNDTEMINILTNLSIKIQEFEIKPQFKNKIYNYFYHYGYKTSNFKKPDYRSRYYFNYLKTIGVNIKSNIDSIYVNELKSMFNNGVTIWHYRNATTWKGVNNYDYENAEMNLISTEVENG